MYFFTTCKAQKKRMLLDSLVLLCTRCARVSSSRSRQCHYRKENKKQITWSRRLREDTSIYFVRRHKRKSNKGTRRSYGSGYARIKRLRKWEISNHLTCTYHLKEGAQVTFLRPHCVSLQILM